MAKYKPIISSNVPESKLRAEHKLYKEGNVLRDLLMALIGYLFGRIHENPKHLEIVSNFFESIKSGFTKEPTKITRKVKNDIDL